MRERSPPSIYRGSWNCEHGEQIRNASLKHGGWRGQSNRYQFSLSRRIYSFTKSIESRMLITTAYTCHDLGPLSLYVRLSTSLVVLGWGKNDLIAPPRGKLFATRWFKISQIRLTIYEMAQWQLHLKIYLQNNHPLYYCGIDRHIPVSATAAGFQGLAGSPAFARHVGNIDEFHIRLKPPGPDAPFIF